MKTFKILLVICILSFSTSAIAGPDAMITVHEMMIKNCHLSFSNKLSSPGKAVYLHHSLMVDVRYQGNKVIGAAITVAPGVERETGVLAFANLYMAFEAQNKGKITESSDQLLKKIYRLLDTAIHNCRLNGYARFVFDNLIVNMKDFDGASVITLQPQF